MDHSKIADQPIGMEVGIVPAISGVKSASTFRHKGQFDKPKVAVAA